MKTTLIITTVMIFVLMSGLANAQIHRTGSDARARKFNRTILPTAQTIVRQNLRPGVAFNRAAQQRLTPDKLFLKSNPERSVRLYFVGEGAGFRNSVGVYIAKAGQKPRAGRKIISFPDVSDGSLGGPRTLNSGDFVDFGKLPKGTRIDPFLIVEGAKGGTIHLFNDRSINPARKQQVVAFLISERFVLIGFEDIPGNTASDRDFNDAIFVLDIGVKNGKAFEKPELPH